MSVQDCSEPHCRAVGGAVELVVESRQKDLGGFGVRRVLPAAERKRVGPFVFFDHFGPARFEPGQEGIQVRPHPHIGLSTLTYLYEGAIDHRDSLGSVQTIEPGAVNWMTAGRGIVHSERTPEKLQASGSGIHGYQVWLALPREREEMEPGFAHHPAESVPRVTRPGAALQIVAGEAFGERSPVETASETLYVAGHLEDGASLDLPGHVAERAVYVAEGGLALEGVRYAPGTLFALAPGAPARITATGETRFALIGGAPLDGDRILWWNLVSSSRDRIEKAKADWREGRFAPVPGESEFIPLPEDQER